MQVKLRFFAPFAKSSGAAKKIREVPPGATVRHSLGDAETGTP